MQSLSNDTNLTDLLEKSSSEHLFTAFTNTSVHTLIHLHNIIAHILNEKGHFSINCPYEN